MVFDQDHSSNNNNYEADPHARRSTYKAMQMTSYPKTQANTSTGAKAKKANQQVDVWGPVFKNKEHFVNMHLC